MTFPVLNDWDAKFLLEPIPYLKPVLRKSQMQEAIGRLEREVRGAMEAMDPINAGSDISRRLVRAWAAQKLCLHVAAIQGVDFNHARLQLIPWIPAAANLQGANQAGGGPVVQPEEVAARLLLNARGLDPRTPDVVRGLIADGAVVDATDENEETPLIRAAWVGNAETIQVLLDGGAFVDAKNWEGKTALMAAAINGHVNAVKVLLCAGANKATTCKQGNTAREYAAHLRGAGDEVVGLLR